MPGTALDKYLVIENVTPTSFTWRCQKGRPSSGVYFFTCDDCIDFLVCGVDRDTYKITYISIPYYDSTGTIIHNFSGNVRVLLAQVYTADQARDSWYNGWSTAPIIYSEEETGNMTLGGTEMGGCYEEYSCTTLREFDTWDGSKDIHITEVQCFCKTDPSRKFTTQVIDYDWSWICSAANTVCPSPICTEGETKCEGYDLYQCVNNQWALIEPNSVACGYVPPECAEGTHETLEYCSDGITEKRWSDCISGKWVYDEQTCPICTEGETKCEGYDLYQCINNQWVLIELNSAACGYVPPECTEGDHEVLEYCPDGITEKRWKDCIGGKWVYNEQECPYICTEGAKSCKVYDLYECIGGKFVLIERNSPECGYTPKPALPPCPIMCVCMGTPLVDCLEPLRVFRDKVLKKTKLGSSFVSFYYDRLTPFLSPIILKIRRMSLKKGGIL